MTQYSGAPWQGRSQRASGQCLGCPADVALAVGGGHYPEKFTGLITSGQYSVGHIIPKYAMTANPDPEMFRRCLERTQGGCSCIIVDWKGTPSAAKDSLRSLSDSSGVELVRV